MNLMTLKRILYINLKQVVELALKLILGIAPSGGKIPKEWDSIIEEAIDSGLSIVNGLHDLLSPKWDERIKDKNLNGYGRSCSNLYQN